MMVRIQFGAFPDRVEFGGPFGIHVAPPDYHGAAIPPISIIWPARGNSIAWARAPGGVMRVNNERSGSQPPFTPSQFTPGQHYLSILIPPLPY